ncbi:MAG: M67 family metallopeptidase [Deltaproteobacteria bacterium]|nr:M67 family metallopeptidase [Deltaproteobacteria bacterium]
MIILPADMDALIRSEGERAYPYECCGLILGPLPGPSGGGPGDVRRAARLVPLENAREGEKRRRRFHIDPLDFLRAEREAVSAGLEILGVYHSHPDHPARPSDHDLRQALPFYSYVIVAVEKGRARELTSWRLSADRATFGEEGVEIPG